MQSQRPGFLKPFFPFYGSKWNIAKHYPCPVHDVTIEPFAGSAGYATYYGVKRAVIVDADPIIYEVWKYLIHASPETILALPELLQVGDSVDNYDLVDGAKWLIGFWLNRGSSSPKKSRTAYSARSDKSQLNWGTRAKHRIASQLDSIAEWDVRLGSFQDAPDLDADWFIDPPYLEKGKYYRKRITDYEALAIWCQSRRGQVVVCEGAGGAWLPFQSLGNFKTSSGRSEELVFIA